MMAKDYIIYMHEFPNGKRYIGQTHQKPEKRWRNGDGYRGQIVYNAIKKYGWKNIRHYILEEGLTFNQANLREKFWINYYHSDSPGLGYNYYSGGQADRRKSIIRRRAEKRKKAKEENPSHFQTGRRRPVRCIETGEIYESIVDAANSILCSRSALANCLSKKSSTNTVYGLHYCYADTTEDEIKKIMNKKSKLKWDISPKMVRCIETGMIFPSAYAASIAMFGKFTPSVATVCRGIGKSVYGYHFENYIPDQEVV